MSGVSKENKTPLESKEQMLEYFQSGVKTMAERKVGTEHEKFLFDKRTGKLLEHEGERGIGAILKKMSDAFDWEGVFDQGHLIGLTGSDGAISLEPGGQFELSGAPLETIFDTQEEVTRHFKQLKQVTEDVAAVCWGLNPWDGLEDVPWMPKSRYGIMKSYLPSQGELAHWMMKMTCTIQANLDYTSEVDAVDAVSTAMRISPFVNALFANSPWREGKESGFRSYRAHIWTKTDNARSGIPEFMYHREWGFSDYIDWALGVPMFFIQRGDRLIDMSGHAFQDFFKNGFGEYQPTMGDFELHLSTVFPEVRLKRYFEMRSADGGPVDRILALPAFWKGIIYDPIARKEAAALLENLDYVTHQKVIEEASRKGLEGKCSGVSIRELSASLVDISAAGLERLSVGGKNESVFLKPLRERLIQGSGHFSEALSGSPRNALIASYDALTAY